MTTTQPRTRGGLLVVALCFFTLVADGYDLIVYGATVPSLLDEPGWGLTTATAGAIGSWTLVGMMVGYLLSGPITDRFGRRKIMMAGILWFSLGSGVCAFAQSPELLGATRFLTGIGLAGVVPSAIALTVEYAPTQRRQLYNGLMMTGYSFGGIVSALAALALLPDHSWRVLYSAAALYVLILPVMYFKLPESIHFLVAKGRISEARVLADKYGLDLEAVIAEHEESIAPAVDEAESGYRLVFSSAYRMSAILFVASSLGGHLLIYGLNTWLPHLMREAGYPLGSSLQFLLVLQLGAIVGMVGGSLLADRFSSKSVVVPFFLLGGISLLALSRDLGYAVLMIAVGVAGLGTIASQVLANGFLATHFPAECRASAVGATLGLGRIGAILGPLIGGWILGSSLGFEWNFYAFAIPAMVSAVCLALVPRIGTTQKPTASTDEIDALEPTR